MKSDPEASVQDPTTALLEDPVALAMALERSQDVKEKVEACADDLGAVNAVVKEKIAEGTTTLSATDALAESERVESTVQECADELHEINQTLAQGINELKETEIALVRSRKALSETEAALATAQEDEKEARLRALHDVTTGLPNRALFDDRLTHGITLADRHGWILAVMFLDLDRFKTINDAHGHAVGDWVLQEVARRLLEESRDEDTVCRYGGDEFLYLLMDAHGRENIERIASSVLKTIAEPIAINGLELVITPSIGIAVYPDHGVHGEELIRHADTAMYQAKKALGGYVFFKPPALRTA